MSSEQFLGLSELRSEVIALLKRAHGLLDRAGGPLDRADHYRALASNVENELHKVAQLELRMALVAPMKAGKSTIVNAILGQSVLPARNSAMTSIPTEIICDNNLTAPSLQLHADTHARFDEVWRRLQKEVRHRGLDSTLRDTAEYPELAPIVRALANALPLPVDEEVRGLGDVQQALVVMNDLCRLGPALVPGLSPMPADASFRVPRLSAPFLRVGARAETAGRLVIVDTPGPNEARQYERLERVVSDELKNTSIVLLVLDYTQLNTQAAEMVSRDVQRVVAIVGEENLFVLINKIDERDEKGLTSDAVRQFVASHLRLKGPVAADRIFEISAKRALCAANFLREFHALGDQLDDAVVRALSSANELALHVYGPVSWQEDLNDASARQLENRAERLWKISKFELFLSHAIETIMHDVTPRCLTIALKVAQAHLATLRNDAKLRRNGIDAAAAELTKEIGQLGIEMDSLERARQNIVAQLHTTQEDLRKHLDTTRRGLQISIQVDVKDFFREVERGDSFWGRVKQLAKDAKRFVWTLGDGELRELPFNDQRSAEEFANLAFQYALDRVRPQIEEALARVDRRIDGVRFDVENMIVNQTRPILASAADRLHKQFDIHLEISPPDLGNPLAAAVTPDRLVRHVEGGYHTETRRERPWYFLWLIEIEHTVKVKGADRIVVSLEDIAKEVNQAIHQNLEQVSHRFNHFVDGEFKDRIDEYFRGLQKYISFYQESIQGSLATQQMSLTERKTASGYLNAIVDEGEILLSQIDMARPYLSGDANEKGWRRSLVSIFDAPVDMFISYSHCDEPFRKKMEQHVSLLRRDGVIRAWYDREIGAGEDWRGAIDQHLDRAKVIVFLVSADFLGSEYCYDVEVGRAMARHEQGGARVVPVILRACDWQNAPFAKLNALPTDGKPVKSWDDQDEALLNVAQGIRRVAEEIRASYRKAQP